MTNEQKEQIKKLRDSGYGYATIAEALGLMKNQVSAFCRRNNLSGNTADPDKKEMPNVGCCRCCGKPLAQVSSRKEAKFCSDACRNKWWNAHLDQVNRKAIYEYTCLSFARVDSLQSAAAGSLSSSFINNNNNIKVFIDYYKSFYSALF